MNANFGLLEPLELTGRIAKDRKKQLLVERAQADFAGWLSEVGVIPRSEATMDPLAGSPVARREDPSLRSG
jgi:hypothetical protein